MTKDLLTRYDDRHGGPRVTLVDHFATRLSEMIASSGYDSSEALAAVMGYHPTTLSKLKTGQPAVYKWATKLEAGLNAANIDPMRLVGTDESDVVTTEAREVAKLVDSMPAEMRSRMLIIAAALSDLNASIPVGQDLHDLQLLKGATRKDRYMARALLSASIDYKR